MDEPRRFGRYTVTGTLGRGAMGHVYAALDDSLGRAVAVKTLHGEATGEAARQRDERFRLEARAVAALNHPGIVQLYDLDLTADPPYLVMERVTGPSLKERFAAGPLPPGEVGALGIQLARALAAAHAAGIVHRDVKPANILMAGPGAWKLADFGVAHVPDSSLTMTGQFIGSPAYAPPEALVRGESTAAGDVFGLGATLYHGATGRWPRLDATVTELLAPVPSVRTLAPGLPAELIAAIDHALALAPAARPTAAALAHTLAGEATRVVPDATGFVPDATGFVPDATGFVPDATGFVPDASLPGSPVRAPTPAPAVETAFVADATLGARPRAATPAASAPAARARWIPWAVGSAVLILLLILAGTPVQPGGGGAAVPTVPVRDQPAAEPGRIRVTTPPMPADRAAKDWGKLIDKLTEGNVGAALDKLDQWEGRWGATAETRQLREQLDALAAHTED